MAVDMFLKIDGIDGETRDHKHKGEIELLSFSWGLNNTTSAGAGGGAGAGKPSISDFSIIKQMDSSSPQLMECCCQGNHFPSVPVPLVNRETRQEYFKIKLTEVLISSYQTGGQNQGGAVPMDQVSFSFQGLNVQAANAQGNFNEVSCNFIKLQGDTIGHNH